MSPLALFLYYKNILIWTIFTGKIRFFHAFVCLIYFPSKTNIYEYIKKRSVHEFTAANNQNY